MDSFSLVPVKIGDLASEESYSSVQLLFCSFGSHVRCLCGYFLHFADEGLVERASKRPVDLGGLGNFLCLDQRALEFEELAFVGVCMEHTVPLVERESEGIPVRIGLGLPVLRWTKSGVEAYREGLMVRVFRVRMYTPVLLPPTRM